MKRRILAGIVSIVVLFGVLAVPTLAKEPMTQLDVCARATGLGVEEILQIRRSGVSFGSIAKDLNVLEEFKQQSLEAKQQRVDAAVQNGQMNQAQADQIIEEVKVRQENCDGTNTGQGIGGMGQGVGQQIQDGTRSGTGIGNGGTPQGNGGGIGAGQGHHRQPEHHTQRGTGAGRGNCY